MELSQKEYYEKLHEDYKNLMSEYEELNEKGEDKAIITKKLIQLNEKHKEITQEYSKIVNDD